MTDTHSGGQAAVAALEAEATRYVFGLIGSATMELFDGLYEASSDIRFIGVRDERTGTHMADGYARASGHAGVVLAGQNGPGATNLVTGLAQAKAAYSPVIALAGMLSSGHVHRDAFQEVDQQALFTPVTKKTLTVPSADRVQEFIQEAHRVALAPRKGPVHINLPRDALSAQTPVAVMTWLAVTSTLVPDTRSCSRTPWGWISVASTLVRIDAPRKAAVRATATTRRASSFN